MKLKKSYILFSFLFLFGIMGYSQKATGDKYFAKLEYADAIPLYKKDYDKNGDRECLAKLAECYHKTKQYENALVSFEQLEKTGTLQPIQIFYLAQLYYENEQPEKGKEYFQKYAAVSGSEWWSKVLNDASFLKTEINDYLISNLDYLNTEYSEFSPSSVGKEILFTSDRPASSVVTQTYGGTHTPFLNIFITEGFSLEDSIFKTKLFHSKSDITSHAGPAIWDSVNSVLYYTFVNDTEKGKVNRAVVRVEKKEGKKWAKLWDINIGEGDFSTAHPAKYIDRGEIVSVDNPRGKGGKDLYYYYKYGHEDRKVHIPGVNTPGDEVFPTLRKLEDGTYRLYFSSDGFPGKGGLDIFSMAFNPDNFSDTSLTWHKELSSSHDDFGVYFDKSNQGYFSSDRKGGKGSDDIYFFIENPNSFFMCLTKKDGSTSAGKEIAIKKDNEILEKVYTDENGCIQLTRLPDGANALQIMDNSSNDLSIKSLSSGSENKGKLMVLNGDGTLLVELMNVDGKMIQQAIRNVILTDVVTGGPAKNIRIEVRSMNGEVVETIMTDENGTASLKKIPTGDKFILSIDADEVNLDPALKNKREDSGIVLLDLFGKRTDSLSSSEREIRISVLKIRTVDLCLYNHITGEPLAHYTVTLRASDGTPIDTAITDANGCYKFKKLPQGEMLITVENYDGGAIKARVSGMEESGISNLVIQNSKGMIIESVSSDGTNRTRTFCVFDKNTKKPIQYTLIHLADEKFVIIDSVTTGADGCFTYARLADNGKNLNLILAADEAEFFIKGKESKTEEKIQYMVSTGSGILLDSISSSSPEYSLGILQKMILSGCLTSKTDGKPLAFTKVYFHDDKGIKIDSTITDKNGCFEYKRLGNLPSGIHVMNNGDVPFQFAMKSNSVLPNKMKVMDSNGNEKESLQPTIRKMNESKNSSICFYDSNSDSPLSGMNITVKNSSQTNTLLTDSKGCVSYEFILSGKYVLEIPSDKVVLKSKQTSSGFLLDFKAEKNSLSGNFTPGSEIIVEVDGVEFISATFKSPDGNPVADLPVEWYDSKSDTWSTSLTENNGVSKHVYNKEEKEIRVRVKDSDDRYSFSIDSDSPNGNVKLMDEKGNQITSVQMNPNRSFSVTVRSLGTDKGEMNLQGTIVSNGNPVNGATIYVKTPQGILIQRTSSDKEGNYFFKKLPSTSMMIDVDTSDLRMKFKTRLELNGTLTSVTSGKKLSDKEVILGDGTGLKLELQNTDENGSFSFNVDLEKIYSAIHNSTENPWNKLSEGTNAEIILNSIYFDYDKWNITFESERELDKAVKFLLAQPTASLNINAHTDSRGNDSYNMTLSRKRARSVMNYFREHGIDTLRLMSFGYGETKLINKCDDNSTCSDALHKKNRRIEFDISWDGTAHNTRTASPLISSNHTEGIHHVSEEKVVSNNSSSTESGRWYKVQISTSGKLIPCAKENFKGVENVEYYIDNGVYKYTVGKFATKEEAIAYRKNVIESFPQAFPVILENGVRVK